MLFLNLNKYNINLHIIFMVREITIVNSNIQSVLQYA